MPLTLDWKLPKDQPMVRIGFAVVKTVIKGVREQLPDLADMFPLQGSWKIEGHLGDTWIAFRITDAPGGQIPAIEKIEEQELEELQQQVLPLIERNHIELFQLLGSKWFSFERFTYVGPYENSSACWNDTTEHLCDWLNHLVVPEVLRRNQSRVLRAIPTPPRFDLDRIIRSLWVLQCDEPFEDIAQGTAFMLAGTGLVTCQHVLKPATYAIHPSSSFRKYPIRVLAENAALDLAIVLIDTDTNIGLELGRGSADGLKQMDHIAVAGFPNYRFGDSGIISPGLVVGFRPKSGIRRILTNASIIAGNSGGPVLTDGNLVVGVAVTGADRMEEAQETEDHGIIPIDALQYLLPLQ